MGQLAFLKQRRTYRRPRHETCRPADMRRSIPHRRKGGEAQAFLDARPDNRKAGNRLPDKMRITVCANCSGRNCRESPLSKKRK